MANVIPHPFEGSDLYCTECQLPAANETHADYAEIVDAACTYLRTALITPLTEAEHLVEMMMDGLDEAGFIIKRKDTNGVPGRHHREG